MWRTRFGRSFGPVVRQTINEWVSEWRIQLIKLFWNFF
jgi:hypothetical protein